MTTLIAITTIVSSLTLVSHAMAGEGGSCHFHGSKPATESMVRDCADQRRSALLIGGKLDASWASAKPEPIELIDGKKGKEWQVRYTNPAQADKAKQTLFVFFSYTGNFIAANFTGQ